MTCQHCQTWILDDDHRCRRCGRRVRSTPSRISPATYPIAAAATAPAYDFEPSRELTPVVQGPGQQALFVAQAREQRVVIPFDSLTSPAERDAIRLRSEARRPAPVQNAKVESKRSRVKPAETPDQQHLEFQYDDQVLHTTPQHRACDAPVANTGARVQAALFDFLLIACGCGPGIGMFFYAGGHLASDKHVVPFLLAALMTVPLLYKLLWAFVGRDTPGMRIAGLELVDFDGKLPSKNRRFVRLFGSALSLLAAGMGMIWTLVDEEKLTWHDHMSGTFPTFADESL